MLVSWLAKKLRRCSNPLTDEDLGVKTPIVEGGVKQYYGLVKNQEEDNKKNGNNINYIFT